MDLLITILKNIPIIHSEDNVIPLIFIVTSVYSKLTRSFRYKLIPHLTSILLKYHNDDGLSFDLNQILCERNYFLVYVNYFFFSSSVFNSKHSEPAIFQTKPCLSCISTFITVFTLKSRTEVIFYAFGWSSDHLQNAGFAFCKMSEDNLNVQYNKMHYLQGMPVKILSEDIVIIHYFLSVLLFITTARCYWVMYQNCRICWPGRLLLRDMFRSSSLC